METIGSMQWVSLRHIVSMILTVVVMSFSSWHTRTSPSSFCRTTSSRRHRERQRLLLADDLSFDSCSLRKTLANFNKRTCTLDAVNP